MDYREERQKGLFDLVLMVFGRIVSLVKFPLILLIWDLQGQSILGFKNFAR